VDPHRDSSPSAKALHRRGAKNESEFPAWMVEFMNERRSPGDAATAPVETLSTLNPRLSTLLAPEGCRILLHLFLLRFADLLFLTSLSFGHAPTNAVSDRIAMLQRVAALVFLNNSRSTAARGGSCSDKKAAGAKQNRQRLSHYEDPNLRPALWPVRRKCVKGAWADVTFDNIGLHSSRAETILNFYATRYRKIPRLAITRNEAEGPIANIGRPHFIW
jgi:hypothetical protein